MKRTITGFYKDDEGHWVARLDCHHGQHVRHRPPFVSRPWTESEAGREARVGTTLDCLKCERLERPDGLEAYRSTPAFDEHSLPSGLRRDHATKAGVWGLIEVSAGCLRYVVSEPFEYEQVLRAGEFAHIAPEARHRVEPQGAVALTVTFLRPKAAGAS